MSRELSRVLERVAERFRGRRLWTSLAVCWLLFAAVGWGLVALLTWTRPEGGWLSVPMMLAWLFMLAIVGASVAVFARRSVRDLRWVARRIEAGHPDLGTGLLAAVEEISPQAPRGYLRDAVLRQALSHSAGHDWGAVVSPRSLAAAKAGHLVALALLATGTLALARNIRPDAQGVPGSALARVATEVEVDPGDVELEKGTSLLVVARFPARTVPSEAALTWNDGGGTRPMRRSLEDPTFAGRIDSVTEDLTYQVAFGDRATRDFRVTVFEYPEVRRTDALLAFPAYTGMETKFVEDIRHVTAVEGTELTLTCRLNKEVVEAALVDEVGEIVPLAPASNGGGEPAYSATWTLAESRRFKVRLVDRDGRSSKVPAEIAVNVTRNQPAKVVVNQPGRDARVSPLEELNLKAKLTDDFGVVRHGLAYTLAEREPTEIVLGSNGPGAKALDAAHLLAFEALEARPDQLVSYFFWAEDIDPDGTPRRTSGDMFFAEVRHFEEIFRQGEGESPGQQQSGEQAGGAGQQAEELAELQKQVINATWTLIRRETGSKPAPTLSDDAKAVLDAQRAAIEQAETLGENLNDAQSREHLSRATKAMNDTADRLEEARQGPAVAPLTPALASAQAAYQALLKLRAREFEVTRRNRNQQQGQGGGGAGAQRQAQLNELELTDEENRYEQRSSARSGNQQQQEQIENRQILNRLAELARRQGDLNDRLKELQSALEAAKDPDVREEIERQLKRLREQEQQILRDADELRERMEREENRERMTDARQALEQSRERIRQAAEALENGQIPQAVNQGARAGRELDELREEFRKSSSDRFGEELTEMREQARRLDERQDALTQQLESRDHPDARPTLRDESKDEIREGLREQTQRLNELMERMRQTVQEAEETEPLLARNLFDTAKRADGQAIPNDLRDAEKLADAGFSREAADSSRKAGEAIDQLREGVEEAARSVLGDETAALERARDELEDLTRQVEREVARAGGPEANNEERAGQPGEPGRQGQQPGETGQPGQQSEPRGEGQQPGQGRRDQQPGNGEERQQPGQGQQGEDQQPGQGQERQQPGQGGREEGQQLGEGQQPGQGQGRQSDQGQQQPGQGQQGQQSGQAQAGQPNGGNPQGRGGQGSLERLLEGLDNNQGGLGAPGGPITGEGFREWTDRMRDVEDLLQDPELRSEAARIRDRVRGAREDYRRHSKEPDPANLREMIADPIRELRDRVAEEIRRRESPDALVPIDRDPVPPRFADGVRVYYERLGSGR